VAPAAPRAARSSAPARRAEPKKQGRFVPNDI
jgi:hypothetical protein